MAKLQRSAHDMFDVIEGATNGHDLAVGNADAVAHIGMMIQGGLTPEAVSDIHDEVLYGPDVSASYVAGYMHMWHTVYKEIFDAGI